MLEDDIYMCVLERVYITFCRMVGKAPGKVVAALRGVSEIVGVRQSAIVSLQAEHVRFVPQLCTLSHHCDDSL